MPDENTIAADAPETEDYAAFERRMQPEPGDKPAVEEEPSEDAQASESADDSETADVTEPSGDKPEDENKEIEKPGKRGIEKRFRDLTSEIRDLRQQLAAKGDTGAASPKAVTQANAGEPEAANFDTYEDYVRELSRYTVRQERAEHQQAEAARAAVDGWKTRETATREKHADYDDVLSSVDDIVFHEAIGSALRESEYGPRIAYELARDRDEAERFAKLNPIQAVKAIGAMEAKLKLSDAPAPKPKPRVSGAPEPISPSTRSSAARAVRFDDPDVDYETFERAANARFR